MFGFFQSLESLIGDSAPIHTFISCRYIIKKPPLESRPDLRAISRN